MHNLDRTIAVEVKGDISVGNGQIIDRLLEGDVAAVQAMLNGDRLDLFQVIGLSPAPYGGPPGKRVPCRTDLRRR